MFPKKIVLASGNKGKLREFETLFSELGIEIVSQGALGVSEVEETGTTFIENAIIKARHAAKETGLPAIADDSGIVVDALDGAPGIYSARFAGQGASDQDNIDLLLDRLKGQVNRKAYFFCMLVMMRHGDDPVPVISQGEWHGTITHTQEGTAGFGYDPVFYVNEFQCTAAQLDKMQKNQISHRGQALGGLMTQMRQVFA
ncbi:RdgB/HAM1 family non-canonical purine NTP pyrophosphatase [Alteromonas ponticola]|uniref:dITP/XTP pyrophosphatase n=1 Tax=Alteromonas aquimaris TaxID=2998417 RepID=A0ABT3P2E7_9ALTE|nr:RdgB/HAM1 family non-canonical purine NTP pyrophosphatase [Alteromonas aquimaris]MCW8106934.1 RdgB/HAM1 family non-canonical purine NTP pyrophosphatase [Alteromonas aquimaris]